MTDYLGTIDDVVLASRTRNVGARVRTHALTAGGDDGHVRRAWLVSYRRRAAWADALAGAVAGVLAYLYRFGTDFIWGYAALALVAPAIWLGALSLGRAFESKYLGSGTEEYRAILRSALVFFATLAMTSYVFQLELARRFVLVFVPAALAVSLVSRFVLRWTLAKRRAVGSDLNSTIVVGRADSVRAMIRSIQSDPSCGLRVVGACVSGLDAPWDQRTDIEGVPVLGTPERALWAVDSVKADTVAISSHPDLVGNALRRLGWSLEERNVDLLVEPGIVGVAGPRLSLRPASGLSMLHVERPATSGYAARVKDVFDRIVAMVLLILFAPLLAVVAMWIKLDSRGPVFFRQTRIGTGGEPFKMVKFRSMVIDAEDLKKNLASDQRGNKLFKMKNDPRVTKVGAVIRKYSIDELPQLINVVKGEMSMIGPRPNLPSEVECYEWDATRRLRVRPGMTGLWQVSGRSDLSWEDSLRLDLWYVDNWSMALDMVILVRTFRAVFGGPGAY